MNRVRTIRIHTITNRNLHDVALSRWLLLWLFVGEYLILRSDVLRRGLWRRRRILEVQHDVFNWWLWEYLICVCPRWLHYSQRTSRRVRFCQDRVLWTL